MNTSSDKTPRILVCQHGARHRYAIPRIFEESGMLAALYTDSTVYSLVGRISCRLGRLGEKLPRLGALASRRPEGVPKDKVFSYDAFLFPPLKRYLSTKYIGEGLQGSDIVYSMCGEYSEFLQWAKEEGAKLIIDIFVHPGTERMVEKESFRYLGESCYSDQRIENVENHFRRSFALADIVLCPSNWVAEGVRKYAPEHAGKIRIVPYGSSLEIRDSINEPPLKGRILFAGREALRKGLHYLADAARILRARGMKIDVRVAGVSQGDLDWMQNRRELNCLGTLPMDQMHHEYGQADVFVLPSLSEGQAGVVLEAMACGCPVIATRESGVDFEPGCGITIPARNAEALADALARVIENRGIRNELAQGALSQASSFSMSAWKSRLTKVVQEAMSV